jgi:hypothetical protein
MQFNATLVQVVGKPGEMKLSLEAGLVEPAWLFEHLGQDLVVDLTAAQQSLPLELETGSRRR